MNRYYETSTITEDLGEDLLFSDISLFFLQIARCRGLQEMSRMCPKADLESIELDRDEFSAGLTRDQLLRLTPFFLLTCRFPKYPTARIPRIETVKGPRNPSRSGGIVHCKSRRDRESDEAVGLEREVGDVFQFLDFGVDGGSIVGEQRDEVLDSLYDIEGKS